MSATGVLEHKSKSRIIADTDLDLCSKKSVARIYGPTSHVLLQ